LQKVTADAAVVRRVVDKWLPEDLGSKFDAKMGEYEVLCKMERVTSTERRANDGRTTGERRANDGRTTGERRANDGESRRAAPSAGLELEFLCSDREMR
jgi:hypothetical protein